MYVCDNRLLERLMLPSPKLQVMFASAFSWIGDFFVFLPLIFFKITATFYAPGTYALNACGGHKRRVRSLAIGRWASQQCWGVTTQVILGVWNLWNLKRALDCQTWTTPYYAQQQTWRKLTNNIDPVDRPEWKAHRSIPGSYPWIRMTTSSTQPLGQPRGNRVEVHNAPSIERNALSI